MGTAIPSLATPRLVLRDWQDQDLEPFAEMNSDPLARRFLGSGEPISREETLDEVARFRAEWASTGCGRWAVEEELSGRFVGYCGLVWFQYGTAMAEPEVAYGFRREAWGNGYASEAARAALAWGFAEFAALTAVGLTHPENAASQRVLAKLGFGPAGTYRARWRLLNVYRVTKADFELSAGGSSLNT